MGMTSSGDKFNFEVDVAMSGIQNTAKVADDIMCGTVTFEQHLERVLEILQAARKHGITMSPTKFYFGEPEVKFVGYLVGREGIRADPAKLKTPKGISDLRSFDRMVNQVAHFSKEVNEARAPLSDLRSKRNLFDWNAVRQEAFEKVKACMASHF